VRFVQRCIRHFRVQVVPSRVLGMDNLVDVGEFAWVNIIVVVHDRGILIIIDVRCVAGCKLEIITKAAYLHDFLLGLFLVSLKIALDSFGFRIRMVTECSHPPDGHHAKHSFPDCDTRKMVRIS
jgi:hypothetical protein